MEFKSIDALSITECCEQLNLRIVDLPEALQDIVEPSERDQLLIEQLQSLLDKDKSAIASCRTIEHYEAYLTSWADGLYRGYARNRITQLKAEAEELAFYKTNQNSISGLESYIKKYPNGRFIQEAEVSLANKKRARKIRNIILLIFFLIILTFVGVYSYEPLPTIQIPEEIVVSQYGDTIDFKKFIANEINDHNIHLNLNDDEYFDSSPSVHSVIYRNDKKDDYILSGPDASIPGSSEYISSTWSKDVSVNRSYIIPMNTTTNEIIKELDILTVSKIFGFVLCEDKKSIKIKQAAGLATFLDANITSEWCYNVLSINSNSDNCKTISIQVSNNGIQGNTFPVFLNTDGTFVQVENSDRSWICIEKRSDNWENNFNFHIRVSENRDSYNRTGYVTFSCGDKFVKLVLTQKSGHATYFDVEKDEINVGPEAIWEDGDFIFGQHYSIKIETDGIWDFSQSKDSYSWLKIRKSVYDDEIDIQVREHNSYNDRYATISISTLNKGIKEITLIQHSTE